MIYYVDVKKRNEPLNGPWTLADLNAGKIGAPKNNLKVFSCFHCGGGSTMGYKLAGYDVIGGIEIDQQMMQVYRHNFKPAEHLSFQMPIQEFNKKHIDDIPKELFSLDILDGSPPCSSFSISGSREKQWNKKKKFREGQAEQVLDDLFFHFIDLANILKPKIVIAENVKGLILGNAKGYVRDIFQAFTKSGYETQLFLLNASRMGVPQRRERTFFIARRNDLKLPQIVLRFDESPISLKIALKDVNQSIFKPLTESSLLLWKKCLPGEKFSSVHKKGFRWNWSRENINEPCRTLASTSSNMICHPSEPRPFTDAEKCRIQSFPDDYDFLDQDAGYVCGMSVPPLMMQRIALCVKDQLLKK